MGASLNKLQLHMFRGVARSLVTFDMEKVQVLTGYIIAFVKRIRLLPQKMKEEILYGHIHM
jgi:hypothetical protein